MRREEETRLTRCGGVTKKRMLLPTAGRVIISEYCSGERGGRVRGVRRRSPYRISTVNDEAQEWGSEEKTPRRGVLLPTTRDVEHNRRNRDRARYELFIGN